MNKILKYTIFVYMVTLFVLILSSCDDISNNSLSTIENNDSKNKKLVGLSSTSQTTHTFTQNIGHTLPLVAPNADICDPNLDGYWKVVIDLFDDRAVLDCWGIDNNCCNWEVAKNGSGWGEIDIDWGKTPGFIFIDSDSDDLFQDAYDGISQSYTTGFQNDVFISTTSSITYTRNMQWTYDLVTDEATISVELIKF